MLELKGLSIFSDSSIAVFKEVWKNDGGTLSSLPKQALSVGEVRHDLFHLMTGSDFF